MKKRLPALLPALALLLSLSACSGLELNVMGTPAPSSVPAGDPSPVPSVDVDLSQDAVAWSTGLSQDDVVLTVNGEDIHADLFSYLLFNNCTNLQYMYYYYTGVVINDLSPYATGLLEDTVDMLRSYTALRQKAAELGCLLTDAQRAEADESVRAGSSQYTYEQRKALYGLTDRGMEYISTLSYYYDNLLGAVTREPTAEELDSFVYQTKHILLLTIDQTTGQPLSDEEKAEKRTTAEDILARLQAVEGEAREALFDELMEEYSEDGRDDDGHIDLNGYEAVLGTMVTPYEEASLALGIGEMSGIVESEYGYHIILRGPVEFRDGSMEDYAASYREYQMDRMTEEWAADSSMVPVRSAALDTLNVNDFFARFLLYYEALSARYDAETAG